MQDSDSKPSKAESMNPKDEREMRETLKDVFATGFPNPERHGCPESVKVKALAWRRKFPEAQEIISHLGSCSPCYGEHEEFVRKYKSRQLQYRLAAVAVLMIGWLSGSHGDFWRPTVRMFQSCHRSCKLPQSL
jgi:hypothetical protein